MPLRVRAVLLTAATCAVAVPVGLAQQRAAAAFEVVSIKPSGPPAPLAPGTTGWLPGGRYVVRQTNLINLLGLAYRPSGPGSLGSDHIDVSKVAAWVSSSRFDIQAHASDTPAGWGTDEVVQPYLRALLDDRFKLKTHVEKRDMPVYSMVVARSDGMLGPGLRKTSGIDCNELNRLRRENPSAVPSYPQGRPPCTLGMGNGTGTGWSTTMTVLAQALRGTLGILVVDHTELTGTYDIELHWTPDARGRGPSAGDAASPASIPDYPPLATAVLDQLGLKLEQRREQQDVLVVDQIEKPAED